MCRLSGKVPGKRNRFERGAGAPLKRPATLPGELKRGGASLTKNLGVRVLVIGRESPKVEAKIEAFEN